MKKKTGIIASLVMLFLLIYSCERNDQIETYTFVDSLTESSKSSNDPLNILTDRKHDTYVVSDGFDSADNGTNNEVNLKDITKETSGCMDAYAYSNVVNSTCFLNDFSNWGWTNTVNPNDRHYASGGVNYSFPLYASAYDCAIENSILVGEVSMNIYGGEGILFANITISLSKDEMSVTDLHIVANETVYPLDELGNPTNEFEYFDVNLNSMNEKSYSVNWLDWFEQTNFIVHVKVCPEEIL